MQISSYVKRGFHKKNFLSLIFHGFHLLIESVPQSSLSLSNTFSLQFFVDYVIRHETFTAARGIMGRKMANFTSEPTVEISKT